MTDEKLEELKEILLEILTQMFYFGKFISEENARDLRDRIENL